jgi:hypothetical protein
VFYYRVIEVESKVQTQPRLFLGLDHSEKWMHVFRRGVQYPKHFHVHVFSYLLPALGEGQLKRWGIEVNFRHRLYLVKK